jgi:hypothetical protein
MKLKEVQPGIRVCYRGSTREGTIVTNEHRSVRVAWDAHNDHSHSGIGWNDISSLVVIGVASDEQLQQALARASRADASSAATKGHNAALAAKRAEEAAIAAAKHEALMAAYRANR